MKNSGLGNARAGGRQGVLKEVETRGVVGQWTVEGHLMKSTFFSPGKASQSVVFANMLCRHCVMVSGEKSDWKSVGSAEGGPACFEKWVLSIGCGN